MSTPYDEGQVHGFIDDCAAAYQTANAAVDQYAAIWVARMQFDAVSMGYPSARSKQLASLQATLGVAPPTPEPLPPGQFIPAPREWRGNMCGVRVPGLPAIYWGPPDPSIALSWLYDRYAPEHRAMIRAAWKAGGYTHVVLSWPDAKAFDPSPERFRDIVLELIADGFFPCVMWCSKDFDQPDVTWILDNIEAPLSLLTDILPLACIGWELSLWLSPTQVQQLIDAIAPRLVAYGCRVYVHFQQGYSSFQQPDKHFADFWNPNVGKLTGVLHQKILDQSPEQYRGDSGGLIDVLQRFAGNFYCSPDSGFGHPFDLIAWEITAMQQFNGDCSQHEGDTMGTWALDTTPQTGPAGSVGVMGSGNGQLAPSSSPASFTPFSRRDWHSKRRYQQRCW